MSCTLRIELEETKGTKANGVRLALGGETLDGTVFITRCPEKKDIEVEGEDVSYLLEVSLDGELSNVISLLPPARILQRQQNIKILRATYTVLIAGPDMAQALGTRPMVIPFCFRVPNSIYGVESNAYLGHSDDALPPSLCIASDAMHPQEAIAVRGECRIGYGIRARVSTQFGKQLGMTYCPVRFIPAPDQALLPLYDASICFGATAHVGYRMSCLLPWFRDRPGLTLHAMQPHPLQFGCNSTVFTTVPMQLRYHAQLLSPDTRCASLDDVANPSPPDISLVVRTALEAVTLFSVLPRDLVAGLEDVAGGLEMVSTRTLCRPQTRKLRLTDWSRAQPNLGPCNGAFQQHTCSKTMCEWHSTASIVFTYEGKEYPIPTFSCAYASRRHFVSIAVRVQGGHGAAPKYHVRLPVQLVYTPHLAGALPAASSEAVAQLAADQEALACGSPPIYTV